MNVDCYYFTCPHCGHQNTLPLGADWQPLACQSCLSTLGEKIDPPSPEGVFQQWQWILFAILIGGLLALLVVWTENNKENQTTQTETQQPIKQWPGFVATDFSSNKNEPIPPNNQRSTTPTNNQNSPTLTTKNFQKKQAPPLIETPSTTDLILPNQDPRVVLQTLYNTLLERPPLKEETKIINKIQQIHTAHGETLKKQGRWQEYRDFYHFLIQLDPDHPLYTLQKAKAELYLGDADKALELAANFLYDPVWGDLAQKITEKSYRFQESAQSVDTVIPLISSGNGFLVTVKLSNTLTIRMMLDTGATLTVIDQTFLDQSTVQPIYTGEMRTLLTANGEVSAPIIHFESLSLGNRSIHDFKVAVVPMNFQHFEGLLGMDFLGQFRFFIDPTHKTLSLIDKE